MVSSKQNCPPDGPFFLTQLADPMKNTDPPNRPIMWTVKFHERSSYARVLTCPLSQLCHKLYLSVLGFTDVIFPWYSPSLFSLLISYRQLHLPKPRSPPVCLRCAKCSIFHISGFGTPQNGTYVSEI